MFDVMPDEWRVCELAELATIKTGKTPSTKDAAYWGGDIPFVTPSDMIDAPYLNAIERSLSSQGAAASTVVPAGTVLFTCIASIGKSCVLTEQSAFNQQINACIPKPNVDAYFLYYALKTRTEQFKDMAGTTAVPIINKSSFGATALSIPPLDEQRRIAEVLRSADIARKETERASVAAENVLRAYLRRAFEKATNEESARPLESLLKQIIDYRGVPPPKSGSGVPLITAKNVRLGYLDPEPREFIAEQDYDAWMRRGIPSAGDILFTTEAPLGFVAEFPAYKAALGQRTITLVADPRQIDRLYLKWLLLSPPVQHLVHRHATGSTAKGIKQSTFRKLCVQVPSLDEQREVAAICESMWGALADARAAQHRLRILSEQLADDLLSARARVPS